MNHPGRIPSGLLLITDRQQARRPLLEICTAAVRSGFGAVMLREKDLEGGQLHELALPIAEVCRETGTIFLINDRIDVALAIPGTGAHVGKAGIPIPEARRLLGSARPLGYSAHASGEANRALQRGADYVTLSPIFPSRSKPELRPRGIGFLAEGVRNLPPGKGVALGGIEGENLTEVARTGVAGAAVMGAVMRAENPEETCRDLVDRWQKGRPA